MGLNLEKLGTAFCKLDESHHLIIESVELTKVVIRGVPLETQTQISESSFRVLTDEVSCRFWAVSWPGAFRFAACHVGSGDK